MPAAAQAPDLEDLHRGLQREREQREALQDAHDIQTFNLLMVTKSLEVLRAHVVAAVEEVRVEGRREAEAGMKDLESTLKDFVTESFAKGLRSNPTPTRCLTFHKDADANLPVESSQVEASDVTVVTLLPGDAPVLQEAAKSAVDVKRSNFVLALADLREHLENLHQSVGSGQAAEVPEVAIQRLSLRIAAEVAAREAAISCVRSEVEAANVHLEGLQSDLKDLSARLDASSREVPAKGMIRWQDFVGEDTAKGLAGFGDPSGDVCFGGEAVGILPVETAIRRIAEEVVRLRSLEALGSRGLEALGSVVMQLSADVSRLREAASGAAPEQGEAP